MNIKAKLTLMTGIPLAGLIAIVILGWAGFNDFDTFLTDLKQIDEDQSAILNADRDAYQAYLAQIKAIETRSPEELKKQSADNQENITQVWTRISGSSQNFSEEMTAEYKNFTARFNLWKKNSEDVINYAIALQDTYIKRKGASDQEGKNFSAMRETIDKFDSTISDKKAATKTPQDREKLSEAQRLTLNADRDAYQAHVAVLEIIAAETPEELAKAVKDNRDNTAQIADRINRASSAFKNDIPKLFAEFETQYNQWNNDNMLIIEQTRLILEKKAQQLSYNAASISEFAAMRDSIDKLGEMQHNKINSNTEGVRTNIKEYTKLFLAIALGIIIISLIMIIHFAKDFARAISCTTDYLEQYSTGNLNDIAIWKSFTTNNLDKRRDEFGDMRKAFLKMQAYFQDYVSSLTEIASGDLSLNISPKCAEDTLGQACRKMVEDLNNAFRQVNQTVEQVATGVRQVNQAASSLSTGATVQASSIQEISASLAEVSSQVKENAENASEARALSTSAISTTESGQAKMQNMNTAMARITDNSKLVTKVIKVIDDIAFQTNLLALNAAVEAARAGRHGKGFAVVAEEVRNLASRSAKAAKETADLIENSSTEILNGYGASQEALEELNKIAGQIDKTGAIITQIAGYSNDQAQALSQINEGLNQIDHVTQQNTSNAEETASATEQISAQMSELLKLIKQFKLNETEEIDYYTANEEDEHEDNIFQHHGNLGFRSLESYQELKKIALH